MKSVAREGRVLVTNHREPEAVILSIKAYTDLLDAAAAADRAQGSALEVLRRSFDERLAALRSPDAGERLRALINEPTRLGGMVKAGASH
jgi:PHD/YefM family antitoxin component YafN of YafNO toxin-antitoxin module